MKTVNDVLKDKYEAFKALVFYKRKHVDHNYYPTFEHYLSLHSISGGVMAEGRPLSESDFTALISTVIPPAKEDAPFIPAEMLFYSPANKLYVWWLPAQKRHLFFHKSTGIKSGKASLPALIFGVKNKSLHVWALKTQGRPDPETPLYYPPFFNVSRAGVCLGDMKAPKNKGTNPIKLWEDVFFLSMFTSDHTPNLLGITGTDLWKALVGKQKPFPIRHLRAYGQKVKDIPKMLGVGA